MHNNQPKEAIIVFSIQSLMDPLFQGLFYEYTKAYQAQNEGYVFHIFTEEHEAYALSEAEQVAKKKELAQLNIIWHPMQYRKGRLIILKKIYSIFLFVLAVWKVKRKYKAKKIIGSLVMASTYCYVVSKLLNLKLITFCFEPHSLYMKEFGIWSEKSLKYRILSNLEYRTAKASTYITAPTIYTVELLKKWQVKGHISRVPISIDPEKFKYSEAEKNHIRTTYNIPSDKYVILYLGKFEGIYYNEAEVASYLKRLIDFDSNIFIFTISPNETQGIVDAYQAAGLAPSDFLVLNKIPYAEIQSYISACDMGLVAIPPLDSQKYRTPVKIGNYLSCGIPFIVTKGVADDDIMAQEENVGVVFDSLSDADFDAPLPKLKELMYENKESLRARCRAAAIKHRGIQNSVKALEEAIQQY